MNFSFGIVAILISANCLLAQDTIMMNDTLPAILDNKMIVFFYKDPAYMELSGNNITWVLKSGLPDGLYLAYFDKRFNDTALIAKVNDGYINGVVRVWDPKKRYLSDEIWYRDGMMNGIRKSYLNIKGRKYTNIYYYVDDAVDKFIQIEW